MKSNIDPMTQSILSRYSFELPIPEKVGGTVSIKCRVNLFNLYDQNSTVQTIAPIPRRLTGTDTFLRQGASKSFPTLPIQHQDQQQCQSFNPEIENFQLVQLIPKA